MEGGTKNNIPLESNLDVKSPDMLVPVSSPAFLHNRQRFQGRYLPTSLRFEHDGWAAGWDVYQFEFVSNEEKSQPEGFTLIKNKLNNNPAYILTFKKNSKSYSKVWWNNESSCSDSDIEVSNSGTVTKFKGTFNGKEFTVTVDMLSKEYSVEDSDQFMLKYELNDSGIHSFTIIDKTLSEDIEVDRLHYAEPVMCNEEYLTAEYLSFEDGVHTWKNDLYEMKYDSVEKKFYADSIELSSTETEHSIKAVLDEVFSWEGLILYATEKYYPSVQSCSVSYDQGYDLVARDDSINVSSTSASMQSVNANVPFNKWSIGFAAGSKKYMTGSADDLDPKRTMSFEGYIPFWCGVHISLANTSGSAEDIGEEDLLDTEVTAVRIIDYEPVYGEDGVQTGWSPVTASLQKQAIDGNGEPVTDASGNPVMEDVKVRARVKFKTVYEEVESEEESEEEGESSTICKAIVYNKSVRGAEVGVWIGTDKLDDDAYISEGMGNEQEMQLKVKFNGSGVADTHSVDEPEAAAEQEQEQEQEEQEQEEWVKPEVANEATVLLSFGINIYNKEYQNILDGIDVKLYIDGDLQSVISVEQTNVLSDVTEGTVTILKGPFKGYKYSYYGEPVWEQYVVSQWRCGGFLSKHWHYTYGWRIARYTVVVLKEAVSTLMDIPSEDVLRSNTYNNGAGIYCDVVCVKGFYKFKLEMDDKLTNSNFTTNIYTEDEAILAGSKHFYIDREDDSEKCFKLINLSKASVDITNNVMTYKCILVPENEFYVFYTKGSNTTSVPGHILYNDIEKANDGINLKSKKLLNTLSSADNVLRFDIAGTCPIAEVITGISINYSKTSIYPHKFFDEVYPDLSYFDESTFSITNQLKEFDSKGALRLERTFQFKIGSYIAKFEDIVSYNKNAYRNSVDLISNSSFTYKSYSISIKASTESEDNSKGQYDSLVTGTELTLSAPLQYVFDCAVPYIDNEGYEILSYKNNKFIMKKSLDNFEVNIASLTVTASDGTKADIDEHDDLSHSSWSFSLSVMSGTSFTGICRGSFKEQNIKIVGFDSRSLTVEIDGEEYVFDVSSNGLFNNNIKDKMRFLCTDTRKEELEDKFICEQDPSDEFQFLKQQWDTTVATENFWWIDKDHVLSLTKDKFILKAKAESVNSYDSDYLLDDWNGDVFVEVASWPRSDYLNASKIKYGVTCAKGEESALFWSIEVTSEKTAVLSFYDPLDNMRVKSITLSVVVKAIGTQLNSGGNALNTYSDLAMTSIISGAKLSSTHINGFIIFGIHFDNNFNQWAIKIEDEAFTYSVVQGYGFVGVNGCLTGGMIPKKYFDPSIGFTGAVKPIEFLKCEAKETASVNDFVKIDIEGEVVGSDSQQWYITKELNEIVSHLLWTGGGWKDEVLPLSNNIAQVYGSPSAVKRSCTDLAPIVKNIGDVLPISNSISTALKAASAIVGYPMLYAIYPKVNSIVYLQQTMGQYAYVHYNSTSIHQSKDMDEDDTANRMGDADDAVKSREGAQVITEDELSFNIHTMTQEGMAATDGPWTSILGILMSLGTELSAYGTSARAERMNEKQNQTSTSDKGNKFSQFFLQSVDSLSSASNAVKGTVPTQTSIVTGVMTLDMFYSTSDNQQISAGPGWVNHNFVAQCVAQSMTTNHLELSQVGAYCLFGFLTLLQVDLTCRLEKMARQALIEQCEIWKMQQTPTAMGSGVGTTVGTAIAISLQAAATLLNAHIAAMENFLELAPDLLKMLGADKVTVNTLAQKSAHSIDAEAKHKYGSKHETFMWPCFDCGTGKKIYDERVVASLQDKPWTLKVSQYSDAGSHSDDFAFGKPKLDGVRTSSANDNPAYSWDGHMSYFIANCKGEGEYKEIPADMAYVIGSETFLPQTLFRNENIGESEPVFPTHPFQDYIIDKDWQIAQTASVGMTTWISCKDTKIIDGELSNAVISDEFCGLASPYTAIEVKRGIQRKYLRPWAITPQVLALNNSGFNCCYEEKAYHAFDGYGYRIINWTGSSGMNKEYRTWQYSFIVNDRFKRSNKLPHNTFAGFFKSDPVIGITAIGDDKVLNMVTVPSENKGLEAGTIGEDKDVRRYAVPVFSEFVATLPAVVKTISSINLSVIDGITSLTTNNRDLQVAYKAPVSVDFAIGKNMYRFTDEYICSLQQEKGITLVTDIVPCLGLTYLGSTPYEAYLYSQATRQYYKFTGGSSLQVVDMIERFRNVVNGRYDFVNQEVLVPCLATFIRLDKRVHDDENEVDNIMIPRLKDGGFKGEVWPPIETIFNTRSWFRTISLPCGVTYQGPNRCIINRFVFSDYMEKQIKDNYGKWKRVPREEYHPFRKYKAQYEYTDQDIGDDVEVIGWTHNPFLLVTSPIGTASEKDNVYEWEITFCWPVEMDKLYGIDDYATVNISAECMTPGGKVIAERPTHIYLHKELFTRTGNYGYYSFRYQSKCGAGNRERLHIWSDQYIAISSLQVDIKQTTEKRTEILVQQVDVQRLNEI